MVAEDERHIRELVVDTLFDCGYDVLEAKNGREAYNLACKEIPDLIILDVMMPEMNWFQVLEKLNENTLSNRIPVVMVAAVEALEGEKSNTTPRSSARTRDKFKISGSAQPA